MYSTRNTERVVTARFLISPSSLSHAIVNSLQSCILMSLVDDRRSETERWSKYRPITNVYLYSVSCYEVAKT